MMLDHNRLRMRRLELRLSQDKLGKQIGQDQSYISRLERGDFADITVTTLEKLADALHVSTDYLLGRTRTRGEDEDEPAHEFVEVGGLLVKQYLLPVGSVA